MATFYLKVISSSRIFFEGQCNCLVIPAADGEKAVMSHHEEMMIALTDGEMRIQREPGGEWLYAVVSRGFCQIANNRAMVLSDVVEKPEEIDALREREAYERAREELRQKQSIQEYHQTQAIMARALVRLKETEKYINL